MPLLSAVRCASALFLALQGSHANQLHKIQNDRIQQHSTS